MSTKALQQSYIGRVIWTPKYVESKRPFLSFSIHIDNHAFGLDKKKTSAKIQCNYTLPDNAAEDEVGVILSRITTKDEPDSRGLAGQQYISRHSGATMANSEYRPGYWPAGGWRDVTLLRVRADRSAANSAGAQYRYDRWQPAAPVSYTHLTLPTNREV